MIEARGDRAAISRAYNFFRPFSGLRAALLERQAVARALELAKVRSGERALEIAVGTAAAFLRLRQQACSERRVIAADLASGMPALTPSCAYRRLGAG